MNFSFYVSLLRISRNVAIVAAALAPASASAGEPPTEAAPRVRPATTYETWAGADVTALGWSVYGGLTAALFGDVRENGWRLRSAASYGEYRYDRTYWDGDAKKVVPLSVTSRYRTTDLLLGYQHTWGPVTIKAFGGVTNDTRLDVVRQPAPIALDDETGLQGDRLGAKLTLETWTRLADWGFLQADASWSAPRQAVSGRLRLGYRLTSALSAGMEVAAYGNSLPDQGRAGTFVRFEWEKGEVAVSAGAAGDQNALGDGYVTANALFRF